MTSEPDPPRRPTCFVIMPISDVPGYEPGHFGRVYEHLLKPAISAAGYSAVRADDANKTDYIVVGIIQKIVDSEMLLCDFSAKNPNVMYELGIRHAFNKPVSLVRDRRTDKVFDIQGLRYTEYDDSLRIDTVQKDIERITKSIKETSAATPGDVNSVIQLAGIKGDESVPYLGLDNRGRSTRTKIGHSILRGRMGKRSATHHTVAQTVARHRA